MYINVLEYTYDCVHARAYINMHRYSYKHKRANKLKHIYMNTYL